MTKNIMVLLKLLENGEVSASDFAGLERGNVRHLPRVINDAREHVEIYTKEVKNETTMETIGVKYIIPIEQTMRLIMLIDEKIKKQLERKQISFKEYTYIQKRIEQLWRQKAILQNY